MLKVCTTLDSGIDQTMALQSRQLHDEVLKGRVEGILALVCYTDGRVRCVRIGNTPASFLLPKN